MVAPQLLANLALERCGTIIACAVGYAGYAGGAVAAPTTALTNALGSINLMAHQCEKMEEAYVRHNLGGHGVVHHIHPDVAFSVQGYNVTPSVVEQIVDESCEKTLAWLARRRAAMTARHRHADAGADAGADPLWWLRRPWADED